MYTNPMDQDIQTILFTEEELKNRVAQLGQEIARDYAGKHPVCIGVLKGVVVFFADMIRAIPLPCDIDFMCVSSYHGTQSTGTLNIKKDLTMDIEGRDIIILEDILDTGLTLSYTVSYLLSKNPASVKICTLLDKPARRKSNIIADYVGFSIDDFFVVGYGLDYDEAYRNLPYVGILKPEVNSK